MLIVVAAVLFAMYVVVLTRLPLKLKLNRKPFNCSLCLAVWTALGLYLSPTWVTELTAILFGAGNAVAIYEVLLNKLR